MMGVVGDFADAESIISLKDLMNKLGSVNTFTSQETSVNADSRSSYTFASTIFGIEDADACLLVGSNPRMEAPLINSRLRKTHVHYAMPVASVGPATDLTFNKEELGNDLSLLAKIADGSHPFSQTLAKAERPMIIVGMGAMRDATRDAVLASIEAMTKKIPALRSGDWNGVNFLQTAASSTAALDLGFVQGPKKFEKSNIKAAYLVGADSEYTQNQIPEGAFVVYQGSHGDMGAARANVILPGCTHMEKQGTYVNTEGRVQMTSKCATPIGDARDDWKIIRAVSEVVGAPLPYNTVEEVRARMEDVAPQFGNVGMLEESTFNAAPPATSGAKSGKFEPWFTNYWMTDSISRNSKIMAKCAKTLPKATNSYI